MQAFLDLIAILLVFAAALTFVSGSLNALFGWNLGLRIGGSSIPLPEDFVSVVAIAIALIILSGFFFVVADFKRAGRFIKKYKWFVLSGLAVTVAIAAIATAQFAPNLALELAVQGATQKKPNHCSPSGIIQTKYLTI
ncbi:MAG: hypothetical protein HC799_07175 [Limnothrix sp. RL_2_0]|nr:hypothetical protein [Limnothrix sp. RL_2_0]